MGSYPLATVLTIEDEEDVRGSISAFLEDRGFTVLEAENGRTGLDLFRRAHPDLILVDLRMPEVDGLEVLLTIKHESPDTPTIVVSGAGVISDAVEALRRGAWDYVLKPIEDMAILLHAVEKVLERARLIRENYQYQHHLEEEVWKRTAELEAANAELAETKLQIIRRLGKAAEYKDNETGRHVIRVSHFCHMLAKRVDLDPKTVELIYLASPMHDLGKIGIPDRILQKRGSLDFHEWDFMKQHCAMGAEMLSPLSSEELAAYREHTVIGQSLLHERDTPLLRMAAEIAAYHHERWDGSGYPQGLSGEDIPIAARIVAVADVYDALSSRRSYKPPFSSEVCRTIIAGLSGTHLDPRLVEVFLESTDEVLEIREQWKDQDTDAACPSLAHWS